MVNSGVNLFAVGKVLGHASYQSTQRYAHVANDTLLAAVEAGAAKQVKSLWILHPRFARWPRPVRGAGNPAFHFLLCTCDRTSGSTPEVPK